MATTQDDPPLPRNVLGRADEIRRCLFSAQRKIDIASFHFTELCERLARTLESQDLPPIPVQAHFEGVAVSIIAAEEKVKEAVRIAYGVSRKNEEKCKRLYKKVAQKLPPLGEWYGNAILGDIREVRNLAIHKHYEKRSVTAGGPIGVWKIDKPKRTKYEGSHELKEYCQAALAAGTILRDLVPQIEELLRRDG